MSVWVIVVAAGGGTRFGGAKQFESIGAATVLDHSVATARAAADGVVVVLPASDPAAPDPAAGPDWSPPGDVVAVAGGASRSASVRAGLAAVPADADIVLVHDAARPLASAALYAAVVDAVRAGADAVVPGLPVADTLKRVDGARVVATVPRDDLVAVQTPQGFRAAALRAAHATAPEATDDAAVVEAAGGRVEVVPGEATNLKITLPADLVIARTLLEAR